jgi:ribose/xylose/arabinose/galactoside ABC-type transport system permease subunit
VFLNSRRQRLLFIVATARDVRDHHRWHDPSGGSALALTTAVAAALTKAGGTLRSLSRCCWWAAWRSGGAGLPIHRYRLQPFIVTLAGMLRRAASAT